MAKSKSKNSRAVTKSGKVVWMNMLNRILTSRRFPECKFFKAWVEPSAEFPDDRAKDVGCLFAHNSISALLVIDHKLHLPRVGIYTLFQGEPVLCGDKERYANLEQFNHERPFKQGKGLTTLDDEKVPQIRPTGKTVLEISLPGDEHQGWAFGRRSGSVSIDAKLLPDIEDWRSITYEGELGSVVFETILEDDTHVKYAVLPVTI